MNELLTADKGTVERVVENASHQAKALMRIVAQTGIAKQIGDKIFLQVEAWQTIARFNGYFIDIEWVRPIIRDGEVVGYESRARLQDVATGAYSSGAEASCMFDETLEAQDGEVLRWDEDFECRSMSQTRAQSKVGRTAFAWVAVMAGYASTPAEEMEARKAQASLSAPKFPFGDYKGKRAMELPLSVLESELSFWESKANDPANKYAAKNQELVESMRAAIDAKRADGKAGTGVAGPPAASKNGSPAGNSAGNQAKDSWTPEAKFVFLKAKIQIAEDEAKLQSYIDAAAKEKFDAAKSKELSFLALKRTMELVNTPELVRKVWAKSQLQDFDDDLSEVLYRLMGERIGVLEGTTTVGGGDDVEPEEQIPF